MLRCAWFWVRLEIDEFGLASSLVRLTAHCTYGFIAPIDVLTREILSRLVQLSLPPVCNDVLGHCIRLRNVVHMCARLVRFWRAFPRSSRALFPRSRAFLALAPSLIPLVCAFALHGFPRLLCAVHNLVLLRCSYSPDSPALLRCSIVDVFNTRPLGDR